MPGAGTKQKLAPEPIHRAASSAPSAVAKSPTAAAAAAPQPSVAVEKQTPDEVLSDFAQLCVALPATGALIAIRDLAGLRCNASFGNAPVVGSRIPVNSAFRRECLTTGEVAHCEDAEIDPRIPTRAARFLGFRSAVALPILAQGSVVGLIEVFCFEPFAITAEAIASLQQTAKSFAALMIFDAAHGGEPVVGGTLEAPIVLPKVIFEEPLSSTEPESAASASIAQVVDQPPVSVAAALIRKRTAEQLASADVAGVSKRLEKQKTPKRRAENQKAKPLEISQLVPIRTPAAAKQAASLAQLPSDRPTPSRVWLIAGILLLALALFVLYLLRGRTPANDDPDATVHRTLQFRCSLHLAQRTVSIDPYDPPA
jgi:GAF domain